MEITKIKNNAKDYGIPIIRSKSHEYLEQLVKDKAPKRILEIGTAVGYSGITILKASPEATLLTIEHNPDFINQAKKNFAKQGLKNRVNIVYGDCLVEIAKMIASNQSRNAFLFSPSLYSFFQNSHFTFPVMCPSKIGIRPKSHQ